MKYIPIILGIVAGYLRGSIDTEELDVDISTIFFTQSLDPKLSEFKSLVSKIVSTEETSVRDFQTNCDEFIIKYSNEASQLKAIITDTELKINSLANVQNLEQRLVEIEGRISEFDAKIRENQQDSIEKDVKSSERARNHSETIEEVSKAIDYLSKVVNSDPAHIEEVLKHVTEIKISLENDISVEGVPIPVENPLYASAINDLLKEKMQIRNEIAITRQELKRFKGYLAVINPQFDAISEVIDAKQHQCQQRGAILRDISELGQTVQNLE